MFEAILPDPSLYGRAASATLLSAWRDAVGYAPTGDAYELALVDGLWRMWVRPWVGAEITNTEFNSVGVIPATGAGFAQFAGQYLTGAANQLEAAGAGSFALSLDTQSRLLSIVILRAQGVKGTVTTGGALTQSLIDFGAIDAKQVGVVQTDATGNVIAVLAGELHSVGDFIPPVLGSGMEEEDGRTDMERALGYTAVPIPIDDPTRTHYTTDVAGTDEDYVGIPRFADGTQEGSGLGLSAGLPAFQAGSAADPLAPNIDPALLIIGVIAVIAVIAFRG
jgi:hypothetical protein